MVPALGYQPTTRPDAARIRAARRGVLGLFFLLGIALSTFLSRMPSIRDTLDVSQSQLATLLIFGAFGALLGLMITGWAAVRYGTRALLWWSSLGYLLAFMVLATSTVTGNQTVFAIGNMFMSFSFAFSNVAMNTEASAVERRVGRAILPQFHASFSVGMAVGLGIGASISHVGIAPFWHFLVMGLLMTAGRLAIIPMSVIDGTAQPDARATLGGPFATARAEYRNRRVVLLGLIIFAAAMTEMVAAQWIALSIVDDFDRSEAVGDLVYWTFVIAMLLVRWNGASIIGRFGRVVTLRLAAVSVVTGLVIFAFTPTFWLVPLAAVLWGFGAALGVPIGFSAAADDPKHAAQRVAAVASFATVAGLVVPPAVGHLAEVVQLREALLIVSIGSLTSFMLARAVRSEGPLLRSRRALARKVGKGVLDTQEQSAVAPGASAGTGAPDAPIQGR